MIDLSEVKAGKYELTALHWDQITSKPGQPFDYVRHRRGDTIDLNVEDARRLLTAGAVVKPGTAEKAAVPGREQSKPPGGEDQADGGQTGGQPQVAFDPTVGGTIPATEAYVGDDVEKATAMLDLEKARDGGGRPTLVTKLEGIIQARAGS